MFPFRGSAAELGPALSCSHTGTGIRGLSLLQPPQGADLLPAELALAPELSSSGWGGLRWREQTGNGLVGMLGAGLACMQRLIVAG